MIGKCHSFLREGGRFFAIWHILYLSHFTYGGGGVQGDLANFTKYAGFFNLPKRVLDLTTLIPIPF